MFAYDLQKAAKTRNIPAEVVDLANYDAGTRMKDDGVVILMMACFGNGEPTSNAETFYKWLMADERSAEKDFFKQTWFSVFGLGQSLAYPERYQQVGKTVDARLGDLGAVRLMPRGEGDDSHDIEEDFEDWSEQLWDALNDEDFSPSSSEQAPAEAEEIVAEAEADAAAEGRLCPAPAKPQHFDQNNAFFAPIESIRELHSPLSKRSCLHFSLDISASEHISYTTGDYVGVIPHNSEDAVLRIIEAIGADMYTPLRVEDHPNLQAGAARGADNARQDQPQPETVTLAHALLHCCDIANPPRRAFLKELAGYASDEQDRRKLEFLGQSSELSKRDYQRWVVGNRMSILEILEAFPSVGDIPVREFVDMMGALQPRFYSISSSSVAFPDQIDIAASIVNYKTPTGRTHVGVATDYLARKRVGDSVPCFVKTSLFRLPEDGNVPIVMIGAGTGVAPFRAFLQERQATGAKGDNVLFFGIGRRSTDFLYQSELAQFTQDGLLEMHVAAGFERAYNTFVQHRMIEPDLAKRVWDLIDSKAGNVYLCGDAANMGVGVQLALEQIARDVGGLSQDAAASYIAKLKADHRFQIDAY